MPRRYFVPATVLERVGIPPAAAGITCLGAASGVASVVLYAVNGFGLAVGLYWLAALALVGSVLLMTSEPLPRPGAIDVIAPLAVMAAFAPLYVWRVSALPVQVNSDEVAIMTWAKRYSSIPHPDLFGLSDYFGHPVGLAVVWGKLGNLLGGIGLGHMRLLHALTGILVVGVSYAFFRQLLPLPWALVASAVLGVNHALVMISRMAMRENTPVLVEVAALALLLLGLRRNNLFATFCGGAVAGLGYYVHFPGRMVFPIWLVFLVVLAVAYRSSLAVGRIARLGSVATAAFALVAAPYVVGYLKAPADLTHHQREALLLTHDGRVLQQRWVFADSVWGGIETNIVNGLTAFNTDRADQANIYPNPGHAIVDPLTGALLWLGALAVLVRAVRRRGEPWNVFPLVGFLVLWLVFAFLVGQAPDYPRMLVILPLVAYLVAEAIRLLAGVARRGAPAVAVLAVAGVGVWNGFIGWNFIHTGRVQGDDIGGTGRFVAAHSHIPGETFYIAADEGPGKYYVWGTPSIWMDRLRIFAARDAQVGGVIDPSRLRGFNARPPFVIFMSSGLWKGVRGDFEGRYAKLRVHRVTPDGTHLAIGVRSA